ncbi:fluoride efflux transporter FluC [Ornithinibacillus halotolerans]|uniref:Fluoride-specific ion channel FluC n=1 Tax=Ornithinibacillus halotolerans TaxID=1274357 RepID=A0A916WCR5_9BACI|nr:CrcB family protein [Ornithinibacillus halotolerans]GGA87026.1 putative fluoride ion transporter CrcB 2 [Ornithinibacillus halotolerans]
MINFILVTTGGFLGSIARAIISKRYNNRFALKHFGTFLVNIIGSFLLGIIINLQVQTSVNLFFGIGFLGSFTTFSTFKIENLSLLNTAKRKQALLYISITYILGIGMAGLGFWIGRILS